MRATFVYQGRRYGCHNFAMVSGLLCLVENGHRVAYNALLAYLLSAGALELAPPFDPDRYDELRRSMIVRFADPRLKAPPTLPEVIGAKVMLLYPDGRQSEGRITEYDDEVFRYTAGSLRGWRYWTDEYGLGNDDKWCWADDPMMLLTGSNQ